MTRRLLTAAAVVAVLAVTAVSAWAAVRLGGPEPAAPRGTTTAAALPGASAAPVTVDQVAPLSRVVPPDVLAIVATGVPAEQAERVRKVKKVQDVTLVDGGAVKIQDRTVNVFAVDPSRFRSWTPPATARNQALWTALAAGKFVASPALARDLKLRQGTGYPIVARATPTVELGGVAPLGVPAVDALVSRATGEKLGLIRDVAFLVNAPGVRPAALTRQVTGILGANAKVVNLHTAKEHQGATDYMDLYRKGATRCPGLSWTVLAAIGQVESSHGRDAGPSSAGALGPMQFMTATWKSYGVDGDGDGKADIMNPYDAIPAAAKYLCAAGAPRDMYKAVYAYNHADWYVQKVLNLAAAYARQFS